MKKVLLSAVLLAAASTSALAWTDGRGYWHEGPQLYGPIGPQNGYYLGPPPPSPGYYGAPYGYGAPIYSGPVVVAPPPTDAQVIAGTILGITSMFARPHYRGW
jgi:hypothetical protein